MRTATAAVVLTSSIVLLSCSDGDDTSAPSSLDVADGSGSSSTAPTVVDRSDLPQVTAPGQPDGSTPPTPSTDAPVTTFPVVVVPESGVPGLDSDDAFCAAWSRFGGSWQVIQVAANFAPDPSVVPAMEIAAAPVVAAAYGEMFDVWPSELEAERDLVADGYFGPLHRRAEAAIDALGRVGVTEAQVVALGEAWVDALATRRPEEPTVELDLDEELRALVDAAADELLTERVPFLDDPSMRISVETPLTDAFLATACPDQGALTGAEVDVD